MRWFRRGVLLLFLTWLLLACGQGGDRPTTLDLLLAPHRYSLLGWELNHLPDKWLHRLDRALVWLKPSTQGWLAPSRADEMAWAQQYFSLALRADQLETSLGSMDNPGAQLAGEAPVGQAPVGEAFKGHAQQFRQELTDIRQRRERLRPFVEETIEGAVRAALGQEGLAWQGGVVFPPVDTVLSSTPHILVASPRDRIYREWSVLLEPDMNDGDKDQVEAGVLADRGLSAVVEGTGGVASYPSVVSDAYGLHHGVVTVAHEWVHQWLFFRPLGQGFDRSPELTTLNETVATLVGEEIGDRAFAALTGQAVDRPAPDASPPAPEAFDFDAAMRETRLGAEELLAQGKIEEAEAYMEQRRQFLAEQGYYIRRINQAYFAFHGSYATTPGSVSPIGQQLRDLRERSASVAEFLNTVAQFGSYQEFLEYVEAR
jgi:hypothetical protein